MFSCNSKSITQVIFVTDIIFDVMTINIQIDRSFFKERHLRTKYAVFLYICLRKTLF